MIDLAYDLHMLNNFHSTYAIFLAIKCILNKYEQNSFKSYITRIHKKKYEIMEPIYDA